MAEKKQDTKRSYTPDWLVQGVLAKLGDTFDRLLGRGWKPSSSLATSELIERLKKLLDSEARENGDKRKFVPHNIRLKMQWDKFSTDSDDPLKRLENELLAATIDHINDRRYYTYAPISLQVKPDYFTSGVKLFVSFDDAGEDEAEALIHVSTPPSVGSAGELDAATPLSETLVARFMLAGELKEKKVRLMIGKRIGVGRTRENDLVIADNSVSKIHASLLTNKEGSLVVADTGSTNGTFINDVRIPYGRALQILPGDKLKFGDVDVELTRLPNPEPREAKTELAKTERYTIGDFEFTKRLEPVMEGGDEVEKNDIRMTDPEVGAMGDAADDRDNRVE